MFKIFGTKYKSCGSFGVLGLSPSLVFRHAGSKYGGFLSTFRPISKGGTGTGNSFCGFALEHCVVGKTTQTDFPEFS